MLIPVQRGRHTERKNRERKLCLAEGEDRVAVADLDYFRLGAHAILRGKKNIKHNYYKPQEVVNILFFPFIFILSIFCFVIRFIVCDRSMLMTED